jgi:hypothetical protein
MEDMDPARPVRRKPDEAIPESKNTDGGLLLDGVPRGSPGLLSSPALRTSWPTQLKLCSSSLCIYICKLRPDAHADTDTDASAATNMKLKEVLSSRHI